MGGETFLVLQRLFVSASPLPRQWRSHARKKPTLCACCGSTHDQVTYAKTCNKTCSMVFPNIMSHH